MQIVRKYDIYLPLEYNPEPDGTRRRIEGEKFEPRTSEGASSRLNEANRVEQKLFEEFGGVKFVQESFPLKGIFLFFSFRKRKSLMAWRNEKLYR
jgi:hypothetical protein